MLEGILIGGEVCGGLPSGIPERLGCEGVGHRGDFERTVIHDHSDKLTSIGRRTCRSGEVIHIVDGGGDSQKFRVEGL